MSDPAQSYMICSIPRSGSTMLCRALAATGRAGQPGSHFHKPSVARWAKAHGVPETGFAAQADQLRAIIRAAIYSTSTDGRYGLRMQGGSLAYFLRQIAALAPGAAQDRARLDALFGPMCFVQLQRRDKLAQAISRLRAEASGLWHRREDGSVLEELSPRRAPGYDAGAIRAHLAEIAELEQLWADWFAAEGITPLRLFYEDLSADLTAGVNAILAQIGAAPVAQAETRTARLADETSRDWAARFLREEG